ncbi:hypothetical protein Tco_0976256 [Tanacetum coccineum]|uniref:Uncharacterized protein n=1 Tax=Tanacetum coccineum TaxID=301880 RepID=A0ABQ5EGW7_9ASTR
MYHGCMKNYGRRMEYGRNQLHEGKFPGAYIIRNTLCYQDLEWYEALKDGELKEEALKNKAIMDGMIDENDESSNEGWKRWDDFDNTNHEDEERFEDSLKEMTRFDEYRSSNLESYDDCIMQHSATIYNTPSFAQ